MLNLLLRFLEKLLAGVSTALTLGSGRWRLAGGGDGGGLGMSEG